MSPNKVCELSKNNCIVVANRINHITMKHFKNGRFEKPSKSKCKNKISKKRFTEQKYFMRQPDINHENTFGEIKIDYIDATKIKPSPYQSRKFFPKSTLKNLVDSIKRYGLIQPIVVRKINVDTYEIISGERRYRACKLLNLRRIPAIVKNLSQRESLYIAMAENIQRNNLNYIEEAEGIKNIMLDYSLCASEISSALNQPEEYILQKLYLLNLSPSIQAELLHNNLTEEYAFLLLELDNERLQHEVIDKIIYYGLSVRASKNLVDRVNDSVGKDGIQDVNYFKDRNHINDLRIFFNTIKQAINVTKESGFETSYVIDEDSGEVKINIKVTANGF